MRAPGDSFRRERDRRYRRAFRVALLVSVLAHALLIWVTGGVDVPPSPYVTPPPETIPAPEGLVVVDVAVAELEEPRAEEPRPEPVAPQAEEPDETPLIEVEPTPAEEPPVVPPVDPAGEPEAADPLEDLTNAERLMPRYSDARLWFDPRHASLVGERLARFARADSAVRAILRDWLDSLRLSDEQRRRALEWTYEKDGKRWGISPEGLHLGDITIPIPFQLMPSGPRRRELEQSIRDLQAIQLQNLRDDLERIRDERREAMRERAEEEARRRRGDTTAVRPPGGTTAPASRRPTDGAPRPPGGVSGPSGGVSGPSGGARPPTGGPPRGDPAARVSPARRSH